ncbi:mono/diheme cytochrome c family protein [Paraburkholderia sp. WSM4175]|uniref:cytochrome c n=1 Tax=Paraburkholderia sp. WSM4175 TaxID=2991072 RepID=UPI003D1E1328
MRKGILAILALLSAIGAAKAAQVEPDQTLLVRGRYLAQAADCAACHTVKGGMPFSGGLRMNMPIGGIYSTNITPDSKTGIGQYTEAEFARALREGVAKDGRNLYPAMPYTSYSKITDADVDALYAYFMRGVKPAHQVNLTPDIRWPLSMRWPMRVWNALFLDAHRFEPRPDKSVEWNRGAYLVQGLGHCGACHTARGAAFEEQALDGSSHAFLSGASLDGWFASNLTADRTTGIGEWTAEDIETFLKTGANAHATAFGPMTAVVNHSTQWLSDSDLESIAIYLKSLPGAATARRDATQTDADSAAKAHGAQIYRNFCVACHLANGSGTAPYLARLAGNPNVQEKDPLSLINVTLNGAEPLVIDGQPAPYPMPAQRGALSDTDVADVLTFMRDSWGNHAPAVSPSDVEKVRRQTGNDK